MATHSDKVVVIIPALNEEQAIAHVLNAIPSWVSQVVVVDNGSTDRTAEVAASHGATVVREPRRGYGTACLTGTAALDQVHTVVFIDGDFSDDSREMARLVSPIARNEADLVIGSRELGPRERGALSVQQRFGNALACSMIRMLFGVRYTDLGPFRAIRYAALARLGMTEGAYGWTVQMQVRAAHVGLRVTEVPVSYRRRIGESKISGTLRGIVGAGGAIIRTIFKEARAARLPHSRCSTERLIIFARHPQPGKTKTRLIPLLGPEGAAGLHRQLVRMTLDTANELARHRWSAVELRTTGINTGTIITTNQRGVRCTDQGEGDLGDRLERAAEEAFAAGSRRVVMIGSDCPSLSAELVSDAFVSLDNHDVVIGPAADGGYYLIGLAQPRPDLFRDIPWGDPGVLQKTKEVAGRLGLRLKLLPVLQDIDTPDDLRQWANARIASSPNRPRLSVIIPALNEEAFIAATLASVLAEPEVEVLVVDGRSTDRTREIASSLGARVLQSPPSRGGQLHVGAISAQGEFLLFLHADTSLPGGYVNMISNMLNRPRTAAGAFTLSIDGRSLGLRVVELAVCLRSRLLGMPYGDQAMFMTVETYQQIGGFPSWPMMEDYDMVRRLRSIGRIRVAPARVVTSGRRWIHEGIIRTTLQNQWRILRYYFGAFLGRLWRKRTARRTHCRNNSGVA
jgi:rSAM/selenodomain-associated transferase 2/rSAM/selenodomain-associated transferase 1